MDIKNQLVQLYAKKGELLTEMEIMQNQLQRISQQIIQIRNALLQEQQPQKPENLDKSKNKG